LGARYVASSTVSDLGLDDYGKFLNELQQSLLKYAKENNNIEMLSKASKLLSENSSIDADLNTILLYLKSEKS